MLPCFCCRSSIKSRILTIISGLTVISSIHQPSSQMYELFDQLMLLVDGKTVFYGHAQNAIPYFASLGLQISKFYNPADFMSKLCYLSSTFKNKTTSV